MIRELTNVNTKELDCTGCTVSTLHSAVSPPRQGETDHARCVSGVEDRTGADVTMEILGGLGKQISVGKLQVVER